MEPVQSARLAHSKHSPCQRDVLRSEWGRERSGAPGVGDYPRRKGRRVEEAQEEAEGRDTQLAFPEMFADVRRYRGRYGAID
jgi:hypothetical protein